MPSPFESKPIDEYLKLIEDLKDADADAAIAFADGDHWQKNKAWCGPRPAAGNASEGAFFDAVQRGFVSKNIVKEIEKRDRNGVIGHEPNWTITVARELRKTTGPDGKEIDEAPNEDEGKRIKEAESLALAWWDTRRQGKKLVLATIRKGTRNMNLTARGPLRLFIPPGFLDKDNSIKPEELSKSAAKIYLMAPQFHQATVITDEDTQQQAGIFAVTDNTDNTKKVEVSFLDDNGNTIIGILKNDKSAPVFTRPYQLGGHLTIYEMSRDTLISPQVMQSQKMFNMSATMRTKAVGEAGLPETTYLNAKRPSHFIDNPDKPGEKIEIFDNVKGGSAARNFLAGFPTYDKDGAITGYTTPGIHYRDPVNVDTFDKTEAAAYKNILEEVSQLHVAISGDATSSGEARVQARADFVIALLETKSEVDAAGRWALETMLAWAADLSGEPGRYADLRVSFDCRLDPGPLTADERRLLIEEVEKRLKSRTTAMALLGSEDPDAEMDQILKDEERLGKVATPVRNVPGIVIPNQDKQEEQTVTVQ